MHKRTKLIVGAALGLLIGGLFFVVRGRNASVPSATPREASHADSALSAPNDLEKGSNPAANSPLSARREATAGVRDATSATVASVDERLRGRVLNAAGAPVVGAQVAVLHASADSYSTLDPSFVRRTERIASVATDERGEFAVEVPRAQLFQLDIDAPGFASAHEPHCRAGEFVEVRLTNAAVLYGRVTRRADGAPISGAKVSARLKDVEGELRARGTRREATSDAAGHYRIDGLAPGTHVVDVVHTGHASPAALSIELEAGAMRPYDIALDPGLTLRGRVTDARTGAPIAGAQIAQGWAFETFVTSDTNGDYEFSGLSPDGSGVSARARGYGRCEKEVGGRVRMEARGGASVTIVAVDFALQPGHGARGRIVDEHGTPLADAYVAATASQLIGVGQRSDWISTASDERGLFELADLRSDMHHTLFVRKEGFGTVAYEFPADEAQHAMLELGDIAMPPAATVLGVVVDASDQPLAHHRVELNGLNRDRARLAGGAPVDSWSIDLYIAARETRTDSEGRFRFDDIAPGDYAVYSRLEGNHDLAASRDLAIERGATVRDIKLVIDRGLSIEGVVRVKDGGPLPQVYVSADPQGEGKSADCEVANGRFKAHGLSATTYTLTAYPYSNATDTAARRTFLPTKLTGIASGAREVVIELRSAITVRGKVLDANGAAVGNAMLVVRDDRGDQVDDAVSHEDGSFEITAPTGERFDLEAQPPQAPSEVSSGPPPDPSTFAKLANLLGNENVLELRLNWRP